MKALRYYLLVIALSLLPLIVIFTTQDLLHTHDGLVHLPRIAAYFKALTDGQIPVRWVGDLNYGYGMPLFNFIYKLPYLISSVFLFAGFGLVNSFKLTLALSFLLSGIFMFFFTRTFFNDDKKAFLVATFYQFAPFRLVETLIRGSFGEVYTYTFLPLVLLGLTLLFKKTKYKYFMLTALSAALLILSHNSVSLMFFVICILFVLFFAQDKKKLILGFLSLLLGLSLAAFYWVPAIFEHKYTHGDLYMKTVYLSNFPKIWNLFIPNFTNSISLQTGSVSTQIGLFHTIALILAMTVIAINKKIDFRTKKVFFFCLLLVASSLFFMQPISSIFWEKISFLRQFQFPWRFLSIIVFATAILSVSFLNLVLLRRQRVYIALITLVILSTVFYWRPTSYDRPDEKYYWNFPLNTTYYGETDVIWSAGPASAYPKERVEVIGGEGKVMGFANKSNLQTFTVNAKTDVAIVSHTQYFPGWRVYVDGKSVSIQFQDPNWRGLITFTVPEGIHKVKVGFEETKLRLAADIISLSTLAALFILFFPKVRKLHEA